VVVNPEAEYLRGAPYLADKAIEESLGMSLPRSMPIMSMKFTVCVESLFIYVTSADPLPYKRRELTGRLIPCSSRGLHIVADPKIHT